MFWTILITVIITFLACLVLYLRKDNMKKDEEYKMLKTEKMRLENRLDDYRERDAKRRAHSAYNCGLYDGRETDRAYRELLKRYKDGNYDERLYHAIKEEGVRT